MKTKKFILSATILLLLVLKLNGQTLPFNIEYTVDPTQQQTSFKTIYNSWDGPTWGITPTGSYRALNIFINIIYDQVPETNPYYPENPNLPWPADAVTSINASQYLPSYLQDFADGDYTGASNVHGYQTRLMYESSFGNLIILGDFIVVNILQSEITPTNIPPYGANFSCGTLVSKAVTLINANGGLSTVYGHNLISDFDNNGDNKIDLTQIFLRNTYKLVQNNVTIYNHGDLNAGSGWGGLPGSYTFNVGTSTLTTSKGTIQCVGAGDLSYGSRIVTHELSHNLFGDNSFHTSGGYHYGTSSAVSSVGMQGGYGLMGAANSSLTSCNGYERWRMHWKSSTYNTSPYYIAANNVNSDIQKSDGNKTFIIRDFVTTGDAIRIKLPYKDNSNCSNQYLWFENHQIGNNNKIDYFQYSNTHSCRKPGTAGIYAYIQIGRDVLESTNPGDVWPSDETDNLKQITQEGNWDMTLLNPTLPTCVGWSPTPTARTEILNLSNPLMGYNDLQAHFFDASGTIQTLSSSNGDYLWKKYYNQTRYNDSLPFLGDIYDAFTGTKSIGVGTNPSTCNLATYYQTQYNGNFSPSSTQKNNYKIYLSGLKITMTDLGNGTFQVSVVWNDYNVNNDIRWTGDIVLKEELSLLPGYNILLDQNYTPYKIYKDAVTGVFASTTKFNCENGSQFSMQEYSTMIADNKSTLLLQTGSEFEINSGAVLRVKNGSKLILENGCHLKVNDGGSVIIESTGTIVYNGGTIELNGNNALLEIQGTMEIGDNATFTFTGDGFVRFNYTASFPSNNITVGNNVSIIFQGTGQSSKRVEILQETLYIPDNINTFKLLYCSVELGDGCRLQPPAGAQSHTYILGTLITSTSHSYNHHRGLKLFGQPNLLIAGCTFKNAETSIYGELYYWNGNLKVYNSTFENCRYGIKTIGGGVNINNVTIKNPAAYSDQVGLNSYGLVNLSHINYFKSNDIKTAIQLHGQSTTAVNIFNPIIDNYINTYGDILNSGITAEGITLNIKCGYITACNPAINLDNATLNLSTTTNTNQSIGGYVQFYKEDQTTGQIKYNKNTIWGGNVNMLYLDNGFNNFGLIPDVYTPSIFCNMKTNVTSPILANNNKWHPYDGNGPDMNVNDYYIYYHYFDPTTGYNYYYDKVLQDNTPLPNPVSCGYYDPPNPPIPIEIEHLSALKLCPTCNNINTPDFPNVKYNDAVRTAISNMELEDSTKNDLTAINLFKQILTTPVDSSNADIMWLANLAFLKMNIALSDAFANGRITVADNAVTLHPSVQAVLDVHNRFSTIATADNYIQQFYLDISKAQIYRLAGRRDLSIQKFNSIQNCFLDEPELKQLSNWKKLTNAENLVLTGQVPREKFNSLYKVPAHVLTQPPIISGTANINASATIGQHVTIGANTKIEQGVIIEDNVTIGNNVEIKKDVVVGKGSIIGDSVMINKSVTIGKENSIGNNVKIKKECVFGEKVQLKNNVDLDEGIKLGGMVVIGENTKLKKTVFIADGSNIGSNGNFEKEVKIGNNVITGSNVNLKLGVNIGDRSFIGNNVTVNANAVIGSDAVINNNIVIGSNAKVCDGKTASSNLANNGKIGTCISPSLPSVPMQVDYNCAFALYRAKINDNFFNGFTAENADTSKHTLKSGNAITFKANTVSVDYFWNFGDCTTSIEESPAHIYSKPGIYAVALIQTIKCVPKTTTGAITILPETKPSFDVIATTNCFSNNIFRLDKSDTVIDLSAASCFTNTTLCKSFALLDSSLLRIKFNWDFGTIRQPLEEIFTVKQIAANTDSILKCFATQSGSYPISLKATLQKKDPITNLWINTDCSDTYYDTLNIRNISAGFAVPQYSCLYDTVKFVNNTSGGESPFTYQWNFGNGESSAQENPSVVFGMAGQYAVSLKVIDRFGCSDSISETISLIKVEASITSDTIFCFGDSVRFNTSVDGGVMPYIYQLFFNPDTAIIVPPPIAVPVVPVTPGVPVIPTEKYEYAVFFDTPGVHHITLIVTDSLGCSDTATQTIIIRPPIVASITSDTIFCFGDSIPFTSTVEGGLPPYTYQWSFNPDSIIGVKQTPYIADTLIIKAVQVVAAPPVLENTIKFYSPGEHHITLIITDSLGCTDTTIQTIYIHQPVIASFEVDSIICFGDTVYITNNSTGQDSLTYQWIFSDSVLVVIQEPAIPAPPPAVPVEPKPVIKDTITKEPAIVPLHASHYTIRLIVSDPFGCSDTTEKQINILICEVPTISGILYENPLCGGYPVAGDTLVITQNGIAVDSITPVITQTDGSFSFIAKELAELDSTAFYSIETKSGFKIQDVQFKTISEWIAESPLVLVADSLCLTDSSNIKVNSTNASNNQNQQNPNIFIYIIPNPNNGNMQVTYSIPENTNGTFEIYDIIGEKLLSYPLYGGNNTFAITGTTLDKGIYFYQATAGNKRIGTDKIVVIK